MTPDEIAALPASWYQARPIPERLLRDLIFCGEWFEPRQVEDFTRAERAAVGRGYTPLSPVERAHARHLREMTSSRRLATEGKPHVDGGDARGTKTGPA